MSTSSSTLCVVDGAAFVLLYVDGDRVERHKVIGWRLDNQNPDSLLPLSISALANEYWRGRWRLCGTALASRVALALPDGRVESVEGRMFADEAGWLAWARRMAGGAV